MTDTDQEFGRDGPFQIGDACRLGGKVHGHIDHTWNSGQRPMVKPDYPTQPPVDLALREVASGMLEAEIIYDESLDRRRTRPEITF